MYYGISIDAGKSYSHKMLLKSFSFLKTCSYDFVLKNLELVNNGMIIYVKDSYGVIVPYLCPKKILVSVSECKYTEEVVEDTVDDISILDDLCDMPTYLVHKLLSKYKNKPSFYRVIKRELISRGTYDNKKYKIRREVVEIELEESDFNDKYKRRREIKYKKS